MASFREIKPEEIEKNPFHAIGKDWMLITAEKDGKVNTMTAAWGGLGVMWNKNVAYIVIRPQRYTKEFVDASNTFSLTFFDKGFEDELTYLGRVSGRDEDKISKLNMTVEYSEKTPYFTNANLVVICNKLYAQDFQEDCFIDDAVASKAYPEKDYHTLYIGEITKVLVRD
ncbi:flavin reductase family protein [Alkaliphilus pronyensis]|uniref:Flavin reductase family protein n=1 Tax=Alkaliphilus pronyensis TaxID=1482732 RepID=A0A6I0F8N8_9FIRM|nr:flavin reductase [Alkaliphilus pronyensis]KAB3534873.1 flavin reductase family protein [Alkaliphilus pronyensis]